MYVGGVNSYCNSYNHYNTYNNNSYGYNNNYQTHSYATAPSLRPLEQDIVSFRPIKPATPPRDYVAEKKASIATIQKELGESIKEKDNKAILTYFGMEPNYDKEGKMTLSEFKQPNFLVNFSDIGVNEDDLLQGLKEIKGDADFTKSKATALPTLTRIGGKADFQDSPVKDLGALKEIGGEAWFTRSKAENLSNLETIGDSAFFDHSEVKDLGNLKSIGGNCAYFANSKVENLGKLETIEGEASFFEAPTTDLHSLKSIGYSADMRFLTATELPSLETIGGFAMFDNSKVESMPALKSVDGQLRINNTVMTKEDFAGVEVKGKIDDKPYSLNTKVNINEISRQEANEIVDNF